MSHIVVTKFFKECVVLFPAYKVDNSWVKISYEDYYKLVRNAAKGFIQVSVITLCNNIIKVPGGRYLIKLLL